MSHTLVSGGSGHPRNGVSPAVLQSHSHMGPWVADLGTHPSCKCSFGEAQPNPKHMEGSMWGSTRPWRLSSHPALAWVCWVGRSIADREFGHSQVPQHDQDEAGPGQGTEPTWLSMLLLPQEGDSPHDVDVSSVSPPALPPARANKPWMCWGGNLRCVLSPADPYPHRAELGLSQNHRITEVGQDL